MLSRANGMFAFLIAIAASGCTADVTTTDDSHRVEVQTPKIETGTEKPDLDPGTDDVVDVDTPLPGDR